MKDDPGEESIIQALTGGLECPQFVLAGPGDDAALLRDGQVLTTDLMVENVHFDDAISPEDLAWKLLAINASDVAACGATPTWALLSIALPHPLDTRWVARFSSSFRESAKAMNVALVGGDTTRSPGPRILNLAMAGKCEGRALLRSGASPEEDIWVSGTLGDASGGFYSKKPRLLSRFQHPKPPLDLGPALAKSGFATAAMDLSDGLLNDLPKLCEASGVGAVVHTNQLPASRELSTEFQDALLQHQIAFGEDYELLFCASKSHRSEIESIGRKLGVQLSRIGETTREKAIRIPGSECMQAWSHFEASPL